MYFEEQERTKGLRLHDPGDVTDWHRAIMPHSTILILAALRALTGGGVVGQFKGWPVALIYSQLPQFFSQGSQILKKERDNQLEQ